MWLTTFDRTIPAGKKRSSDMNSVLQFSPTCFQKEDKPRPRLPTITAFYNKVHTRELHITSDNSAFLAPFSALFSRNRSGENMWFVSVHKYYWKQSGMKSGALPNPHNALRKHSAELWVSKERKGDWNIAREWLLHSSRKCFSPK